MNLFRFIPGYETYIFNTDREPAFIMLLTFVLTYILTRGYTRIARKTGWGSASFGGVHTHHMVFGLIIAFAAGASIISFLPEQGPLLLVLAALFGCGASLVLDEFALIFHLKDVYWEKEGRKSVDAIVLGLAFGGMFLLHVVPLNLDSGQSGWILVIGMITNLFFSVIAALKGKIYMAIFGIFIPTLALVSAIRLAEPESVWARKRYKNKPKKLDRSKHRFEIKRAKWGHRKERIWDIIGGKIGRP